jgi:hypothetical protein
MVRLMLVPGAEQERAESGGGDMCGAAGGSDGVGVAAHDTIVVDDIATNAPASDENQCL